MEARTTCDGLDRLASGSTMHEPFVILTDMSEQSAALYMALQAGTSGVAAIGHYGVSGPVGEVTRRMTTLNGVKVASVEVVTMPDPSNPAQFLPIQRITLVYDQITVEEIPLRLDGTPSAPVTYTESGVHFVPLAVPGVDECLSSQTTPPTRFMRITDSAGGDIQGDSTHEGEEHAIEVYDVCQSIGMPWNTATGQLGSPATSSTFAIVKRVDRSSPLLRQSMASSTSSLDIVLHNYGPATNIAPQVVTTNHMTQGHVVGIDQFVQADGSVYERLLVSFAQATLTWNSDATQVVLNGSTP